MAGNGSFSGCPGMAETLADVCVGWICVLKTRANLLFLELSPRALIQKEAVFLQGRGV